MGGILDRRTALGAVVAAAVGWRAPARAADYRPVRCDAARPYLGPDLHAPLSPDQLPPAGVLSGTLPPAAQERLAAAVHKGLAASPKVRALTVALAAPDTGLWSMSRPGPDEPPSDVFYWASAGKMFTAAVILQLAQEGRLRLEDPIATWAPAVPNAQAITVAHLLQHTSGLFSANEDLKVRAAGRRLSFDDEVQVLVRHGAMSCPGERWRYSNSGYAVLGGSSSRSTAAASRSPCRRGSSKSLA